MASHGGFTFPNLTKIVPDAYHGTDASNVASIKANGFRISSGKNLYLGDGVYFYESSKKHAIGYPKLHNKTCKVAVFRCDIDMGDCLDFHNQDHKEAIRKFAAQIRHLAFDSAAFRKQHNICSREDVTEPFIINLAAQISKADTVRATHGESGNPLFEGSKISAESRLVIAVRNTNKILATTLDYVES